MNFKKNINTNNKPKEKIVFHNLLSKLGLGSKILIILIILTIIIFFATSIWIKPKKYRILYDRLSDRDGGAIISQLVQMNIPYKFNESSGLLSVPYDKVYETRFHLAEHGLPKGSSMGFELLDKEKFGISQFNEQINYQRALEGELSRTIERLDLIKSARVHIALPKSSLFVQEKKEPTASVILNLKSGQFLDRKQINAILHFIASSISGLKPNHITILNQSGDLLNHLDFIDNELNDVKIRYTEELEKRYKKRIEDILIPVVGLDNIHAQVTAQIDFNHQEKTEEKYNPNFNSSDQAIRSHQSTHDIDFGNHNSSISNADALSDPSSDLSKKTVNHIHKIKVLNADKPENIKLKKNNNLNDKFYFSDNAKHYHDDVTNYELDHTILRTKINIGEIKRLSTAVIVNFLKDEKGKYTPLSNDLMKQINYLTRQAIGYSEARGDTVNVVNALFVDRLSSSKISDLTTWNKSKYHTIAKIDKRIIDSENKKEDKIESYLIWKKLTESNFLLVFYPFIILFLFFFIFLQLVFFRKKINRYESSYIKYKHEKQKKIDNVNTNKNEDFLSKNKHVIVSGNVENNSIDLSKNDSHIIEMIIREWMSDKKS